MNSKVVIAYTDEYNHYEALYVNGVLMESGHYLINPMKPSVYLMHVVATYAVDYNDIKKVKIPDQFVKSYLEQYGKMPTSIGEIPF